MDTLGSRGEKGKKKAEISRPSHCLAGLAGLLTAGFPVDVYLFPAYLCAVETHCIGSNSSHGKTTYFEVIVTILLQKKSFRNGFSLALCGSLLISKHSVNSRSENNFS